jgi:rhodanese-related sulfurtransferase
MRTDDEFADDPLLIPGSARRAADDPGSWAFPLSIKSAVVVCRSSAKLSQGVAAWLRHEGKTAETLEGGFEAWSRAGQALLRTDNMPKRDTAGRTVWVTRARPKIDRIACPWLIRRFVDPHAVLLFVAASEVFDVAERFSAAPFDSRCDTASIPDASGARSRRAVSAPWTMAANWPTATGGKP